MGISQRQRKKYTSTMTNYRVLSRGFHSISERARTFPLLRVFQYYKRFQETFFCILSGGFFVCIKLCTYFISVGRLYFEKWICNNLSNCSIRTPKYAWRDVRGWLRNLSKLQTRNNVCITQNVSYRKKNAKPVNN